MRRRWRRFDGAAFRNGIGRCDTIWRVMKEREKIIGVLRELGRRLWMARTIRETAFVVCVVLFCLVCFQLIRPALAMDVPSAVTLVHIALSAAFAAVIVGLAWRIKDRVSTRQAAAEADARAQLKDELKSAHWLLSEGLDSPFAQLQVQRAAATAVGLDLAALFPRKLPVDALLAAGLGILLAALIWMTPQLSRLPGASRDADAADHRESADLRSWLRDAPRDAEVVKLDLALARLQQPDVPAEEKMRALAEARDAIDQANMEASAAREEMAKLAETLKTDPKFEAVTLAIDEGRMEDAAALLRKVKSDSVASLQDQSTEPADKGGASESPAQAPERDGRSLADRNAAVNQDAINRVIQSIEQANERFEVQNRVNNIRRRMEDSLVATNQRSQLTASQFDNRTNAPNPTPSPETGSTNVRGGTLFRQAAVAREDNDNARDGSQTGDASGDSMALPLEGAATSRLDAQLKLETILQRDDADEGTRGKGDQGWFYSASREQRSTLRAEDARTRSSYDREDAIDHDRVPMGQKAIVKNYFLNLHESEKR